MELTLSQLRKVMPRLQVEDAGRYLPLLNDACAEFLINTPLRMAAFLAQVAHESGQLRYWEEIWGLTEQQLKYEPPHDVAIRLGNTLPGDGYLFRGRGPIQLTGRINFRRCGAALQLPLEEYPDLAAQPEVGFRVAGWFWHVEKRLNAEADKRRFIVITLKINGSYKDLDKRTRFYQAALAVLEPDPNAPPTPRGVV